MSEIKYKEVNKNYPLPKNKNLKKKKIGTINQGKGVKVHNQIIKHSKLAKK
jgi:hypothetical protein